MTSLVVGWLSRACTVAKRCILAWNTNRKPYPRNSMVQLSTPWVTPNRGMPPPPWGAFCQITLTSCLVILRLGTFLHVVMQILVYTWFFTVSYNSTVTIEKNCKRFISQVLLIYGSHFFGMIPVVTLFVVRDEACGNDSDWVFTLVICVR